MGHLRARAAWIAAGLAISVLVVRGQSADERHVIIQNLGLPAVDEGLLVDETHAPHTTETLRRVAMRKALERAAGPAAARYVPGRLIVKFSDNASPADRAAALGSASSTALMTTRPSYANFDIVRIDPSEDAEKVATTLGARAEVEYAQPAYSGWHTVFVPNDPLYATRQWNLPLINLECAWDLQPQAGSTITVAVLDTGMAYQNATLIENMPAFRDDGGWMIETGTAYVLLGTAAALVMWPPSIARVHSNGPTRLLLGGFIAVVWLSYVFYLPFDSWWWLRFLLPLWPTAIVLAVALVGDLFTRMKVPGSGTIVIVLAAMTFVYGYRTSRENGVFGLQKQEARCIRAAAWVNRNTDANSVFFAGEHSGMLRFYTGRTTVRFEFLDPSWLDRGVAALSKRGYHAYIALEPYEEELFKRKFASGNVLGRLDWDPVPDVPDVHIFDTQGSHARQRSTP